MNTGTWTLIAWLCILGFVPVGTWLGWHYGRIEGRHEGRCAEKERELARRHRAELRVPYEGPEIRAKTGPANVGRAGSPVSVLPGTMAADHRAWTGPNWTAPRDAVTAADLAPVIVPEPGTHKPQPGGTGPHTATMPKITDTGEIRKLTAETDAWLAGMRQKGLIT